MVVIVDKIKQTIIEHAVQSDKLEVCGILAGRAGQIEKVYQMKNVSDKPELCYLMDPAEQFKVMKAMRQDKLEMVGIYHSHPNSEAYPSARDVELAFYPEVLYVIISKPSGFFPSSPL